MTTRLNVALKSIETQFFDFARDQMVPLPGLGRLSAFPENLWEKMGRQNLLNPTLFNGQGLENNFCLGITRAGRSLVHGGGNLGMGLSWMIHHLVVGFLLGDIKDDNAIYRPLFQKIPTGRATVSFAVSEPKGGAHPKYMAARAEQRHGGYLINGEKTYLTNGPIAHAFVVIAVTGYEKNKKQFSAFLVPKDTRGLAILPSMEIPFFKPSPHGGICLHNCWVPGNALLGRFGHAHQDMVLPFREIENAAMTGPVTGAMGFLLDALGREMAKPERANPNDGEVSQLGGLVAMLETADLLSQNLASTADDTAFYPGPGGILLQFKNLVSQYMESLGILVETSNLTLPDPCGILIHDLKSSAKIGKTISRIKQVKLGRTLLEAHSKI